MSYDLCFWAEARDPGLTPEDVYGRLLEGQQVDGLADFRVEEFLAALAAAFPDGIREPNGRSEWFVWEGPDAMFEVNWSSAHVLVTMRPLNEAMANQLIALARAFEMPLYDPQINERFAPGGRSSA